MVRGRVGVLLGIAKTGSADAAELAAEISALRVSLLGFSRPRRGEVEVVFDGPEETYWTCT